MKPTALFPIAILLASCVTQKPMQPGISDSEPRLLEPVAAPQSDAESSDSSVSEESTPSPRASRNGSFSLEHTFDGRGFNTTNLTGSAALAEGWSLWGFIDLNSTDGGPSAERSDSAEYFFELDLKHKVSRDVGVVLEVNDATGDGNALGRAGAFYVAPWAWLSESDAKLFAKVFPYETDGKGWQASFSFAKRFPSFADDRLSIAGFFDANFNSGSSSDETNIVTETQVRYRVGEGLNVFAEFRVNEFLADDSGVGLGLQLVL